MSQCESWSPAGHEPIITAPDPLPVPPPKSRDKPRFWRTLACMILGACLPLDLYAVNLFFIGCPVHRVLDRVILHYVLNLSFALLLAAGAMTLVGIPLHMCRRRAMRARDMLFAGE